MATKQDQQQQNKQQHAASLRLAKRYVGRTIKIKATCGRGGNCYINAAGTKGGFRAAHNTEVATTNFDDEKDCRFLVEAIPEMPGVVAFCLESSRDFCSQEPLYLTNIMYGDEARQEVATALASVPGILADNIGTIVDYAVGRPTEEGNFEGAGFNYSPMMMQRGPPNKLQMFTLEPGIGVKSLFGTYWRSQWWNHTVSQSPHLKGDEKWNFSIIHKEEPLFVLPHQAVKAVEEEEEEETATIPWETDAAYETAMEQARKALGLATEDNANATGSATTTTVAAVSSSPAASAGLGATNPPFSGGFQLGAATTKFSTLSGRSSKSATTTRRRRDPAATMSPKNNFGSPRKLLAPRRPTVLVCLGLLLYLLLLALGRHRQQQHLALGLLPRTGTQALVLALLLLLLLQQQQSRMLIIRVTPMRMQTKPKRSRNGSPGDAVSFVR